MFFKFALRDLAALAICLLAWRFYGAAPDSLLAAFGLGTAAVLATMVVTYLVHEWGHLGGAVFTGSTVYAPRPLFSVFLFHFDGHKNSRRQFVGMSVGGFVTSLGMLITLFAVLPLETWPARITIALVAIGIVGTAYLEVPTAWRVHRGAALPSGPVYEPFPTATH